MNNDQPLVFPPLIYLPDFNGNFTAFFDAVYEAFRIDFVDTRPHYRGTRLGLKAYPMVDERESTFYHITHEGGDEANRQPDLRRMERIRYPKYIINNSHNSELLVWENNRGRDSRILIYHQEEEYLVVLNKRHNYILLWTAYSVINTHSKNKLLKEYEAYINANAAQ